VVGVEDQYGDGRYVEFAREKDGLFEEWLHFTFFRELDRAFGGHGRRKVLDLGCGGGAISRKIVRRYGNGVTVLGLDITRAMLEGAQAGGDCGGAIAYHLGNMLELSKVRAVTDAAPFQAVTSSLVLGHMRSTAELHRAFSEMLRVLAPGGVSIHLLIPEPIPGEKEGSTVPVDLPMSNGPPVRVYDTMWAHTTYRDIMNKAGFKDAVVMPCSVDPAAIERDGEEKWKTILGEFGGFALLVGYNNS